jgi:nucleoside phosphorylase
MGCSMTSSQRAIILTALPVEYGAVRAHLTDLQEKTHSRGTVYEQGSFVSTAQTWEMAIVEIGQGNPAAAVEAERAIHFFEPQVILFVGIAGGLRDVALGDVVAGTKVYAYESGKDEATFAPRPNLVNSTYRLEQRARAEARRGKWLERIKESSSATPRAHVGPLAAGAKVVASTKSATYKLILSSYGDALAVEMEGYGFLLAALVNPGVEALVVRGVSDLIDGKREADAQGYQEVAARNASAFAFEVLANFGLPSQVSAQEHHAPGFKGDPRIDQLIQDVGVGDWDAARDAAFEILKGTDESGRNKLFECLLEYQEYPYDEDMRWGALMTIECFAELAPWLVDHKLLAHMANHTDFSIRSSAASMCMNLAQYAPDRVPMDILVRLARHDEDWYVMAPAFAALKAMAQERPVVLYVLFNQLHSPDGDARECAAAALADIGNKEPAVLDPERLNQELSRLRRIGDHVAAELIREVVPKVEQVQYGGGYKYGL